MARTRRRSLAKGHHLDGLSDDDHLVLHTRCPNLEPLEATRVTEDGFLQYATS